MPRTRQPAPPPARCQPQVTKNAATLEKAVSAIACAQLVADVVADGEPPELQEFYERMEQARGAAAEAAVRKYRSLTPILCKVSRGGGMQLAWGGMGLAAPGWHRGHRQLRPRFALVQGALPLPLPTTRLRRPLPNRSPMSQIEELVAGSNNGRSPQLASYYFFWEQAVFNALAVMLLRGLERLHAMLGPAARQPLFMVGGGRAWGRRGADAHLAWRL